MQQFANIPNHPDNGLPRIGSVKDFNWKIHDDKIIVPVKPYYVKTLSPLSLDGTLVMEEKPLTIDDKDRINLNTGELILEADYDPEVHTNTAGQYEMFMALSTEDLFEQIFPGVKTKLVAAGITEFELPISQALLAIIVKNVEDSANRGKFD